MLTKKIGFLLVALPLAAAAAGSGTRPNVVFVLTDDLGYGDVGWTAQRTRPAGLPRIHTPFLDRLAREGVVLSSHYCAAPVSAPSRASLLTGRLQGCCSVQNNQFDHPIAEKDTLGTVMRSAGYSTYAVGKWGVAGGGESGRPRIAHPLDRGFDHFYGFLDHLAGHTYYHYRGNIRNAFMGVYEDRAEATDTAVGRYSTDLFIARAKAYVAEAVAQRNPFFLYLAVNTVHGSGQSDDSLACKDTLHVPGGPYPEAGATWPLAQEPRELRNTWIDPLYRDLPKHPSRYATAVTRLDTALADFMRHLETLGVADNTIFVFTSDNGPADEYGADTRTFQSAGPFDGFKRDVYEGGLRVPTFVWRKGGFPVHEDIRPSISVDWMATLADLAGVPAPAACQGVSLLPRWTAAGGGADSTIKVVYSGPASGQADYREFAARKLHLTRGAQQMYREGDIVHLQAGGTNTPWRAYDVVRDPHEDVDLAAPTAWYVPGWLRCGSAEGQAWTSFTNTFPSATVRFHDWHGNQGWGKARTAADAEATNLVARLAALPDCTRTNLTLVGHSLGGRIVSRSLALLGRRGLKVKQGIVLAGAIPNNDPDLQLMGAGSVQPVLCLCNPEDVVLRYAYRMGGEKSSAFGAGGALGELPNVIEQLVPCTITSETEVKAAWGRVDAIKRISNHLATFYFAALRRVMDGELPQDAEVLVPQEKLNWKLKVVDAGLWWTVLATEKGWKLERHKVTGHCRILNAERRRVAWGREDEMRAAFQKAVRNVKDVVEKGQKAEQK